MQREPSAISKRLRFEILRRDGHRCRYCGKSADDAELTIDHVLPVALGGRNEPANLATACRDCNAGKTSVAPDQPIVEDVAHDALKWRAAMEQAAEFQSQKQAARRGYIADFREGWGMWTCGDEELPLPKDWRMTLGRFYDLGLERQQMAEALEIAMNSRASAAKTFRYFCGVCWRILEDRQRMATDLLANEEAED